FFTYSTTSPVSDGTSRKGCELVDYGVKWACRPGPNPGFQASHEGVNVGRNNETAVPSQQDDPGSHSAPQVTDLHNLILASRDQDKAEDVVSLELTGKSSLADFMIIASGRSSRQVAAMAEHVQGRVRDAGFGKPRIEG